jgi:membrane fusion protein, multidrug efflux system
MNKSAWYALLAIMVLTLWILSGHFADSPVPGKPNRQLHSAVMSVAVIPSSAVKVHREIIVQGQLEPFQKVDLRAETAGQVSEIMIAKGEKVSSGQVLLALQENDRPQQIFTAEAEIASKALIVKGMQKLRSQGLQAEANLKQAQADLAAAQAEHKRLQLDLAHTKIRAPFAGVVEQRAVENGSYVEVGDQVVRIVDNSTLKAVGWVTQQNIGLLATNQPVVVQLLDGRQTEAKLSYISQEAKAETRSFRVEAEFANRMAYSAGVSVEMRIAVSKTLAHFLSPSVLTLDDAGVVGVKAVGKENQVIFYPVEVIRSEVGGLWLTGLPSEIRVIARGQGFVVDGETVKPLAL